MTHDNEHQNGLPDPARTGVAAQVQTKQRMHPATLIAVAVVALAVGVAAVLIIVNGFFGGSSGQVAPYYPASTAKPTTGTSQGPSGGLGALPPLPGGAGGGGQLQLMLNGRVIAISGTSITIGGNGPSVHAAINSSNQSHRKCD